MLDVFQHQIGNQGAPDLDTHCVFIVSKEVAQWAVLFNSFEEQFYLPSPLVNIGNSRGIELVMIGQELQHLPCSGVLIYDESCFGTLDLLVHLMSKNHGSI